MIPPTDILARAEAHLRATPPSSSLSTLSPVNWFVIWRSHTLFYEEVASIPGCSPTYRSGLPRPWLDTGHPCHSGCEEAPVSLAAGWRDSQLLLL